jgi:chemotaxis protein MotB
MRSSSISNMETQEMPRRKPGVAAFVVAAVLALVACALAAYAWQLWTAERKTRAELQSTQGTVLSLQKEQKATGLKVSRLEAERGERTVQLGTAKTAIGELEAKLAATEAELDDLEQERAKIGARLAEFRAMTAQFQRMIDSGRLQVRFRRGRMIVEMPAQVLFPSASATLSEDGSAALREVAGILRNFRNKHFIVAGHTDNIPIGGPGAEFDNNWDLSTARAVHVTQALIRFGLLPRQLVAAGYAEYDPIASNTSPQGRQKNRRIEIILEPRLKELPEPSLKGVRAAAR